MVRSGSSSRGVYGCAPSREHPSRRIGPPIPSRSPMIRPRLAAPTAAVLALAFAASAFAAGNGKLQIHHMMIGQGDGTLLISPNGQTALFDNGVYTNCTYIKTHLQGLGITSVDYSFL